MAGWGWRESEKYFSPQRHGDTEKEKMQRHCSSTPPRSGRDDNTKMNAKKKPHLIDAAFVCAKG
jgi:hypothetical protein